MMLQSAHAIVPQVGIEHIPELTSKTRRNLARDPALAQLVADGEQLELLEIRCRPGRTASLLLLPRKRAPCSGPCSCWVSARLAVLL